MNEDNLEQKGELRPEYDLKSLRVRRLGRRRKSFNGLIVPFDADTTDADTTDAVAGIQRGIDDFEAGRFRSLEKFAKEKRRQYNLPTDS
jgi:hypothetical protein